MAVPTIRPNIILTHWHDFGRHASAYGVTGVTTESLDRLAGQGLRFDRAFAAAPLSSPARGALFTGRYPHANKLLGPSHLGWTYAPNEHTLPMLLARAGYHTALAGLQHESVDPSRIGFAEVLASGDAAQVPAYCRPVTDATLAWLDDHAGDERPFLLTVGYTEAHRPYPPQQYPPDDPGTVEVPDFLPDNSCTRADLAAFQSAVRAADRELGRLLDRIDELDLAESTWVIFTTDHGVPFPRAKSTLYDTGIGVALVMRPPGRWAGRRGDTRRLVSHVDLVPTVLDRLSIEVPDNLQGVSHARWLDGDDTAPGRGEIYAEKTHHEVYDPMRCVRTERWKYIRNYEERPWLTLPADVEASLTRRGYGDDHLRHRPPEELYDLDADPGERVDLTEGPYHVDVRAELADLLVRWRYHTNDPLLNDPVPRP